MDNSADRGQVLELAEQRDRIMDECLGLDSLNRDIIRVYIVTGQLSADVPIRLRHAQERLLAAINESLEAST